MTFKIQLAEIIERFGELSCHDVRTVCGNYCDSGDRRLRQLAQEYRLRKQIHDAYEYRDKWYYFKHGFRRFCGVWAREQQKRQHGRAAA